MKSNKSTRLFVLFAFLVLVIAACSVDSASTPGSGTPLGTLEALLPGEPSLETPAPTPVPRMAQLTGNHGEVSWRETAEGSWTSIEVGADLDVGNQIMTGISGRAVITFTEGSIVRLAENALFTIQEIGGDEAFW